ncbi:DUF4123 domain-containing protein [Siccibacter turicensis]|uniref:DUF4123 domain-containing protein n=1 Tax=Siccibacter turicensis TaxID=357233 RepID=C7C502_9ENTR|nr:DUF4123 domain-containing protein [Siccibacter turicensis]CAZ90469.1 hypothetical protein [Siccibacter turicensis LMG 23730]
MNTSHAFLLHSISTQAQWQEKLAQGGCFVIAEAATNSAVPGVAERWGGSLEHTRLYWGETGRVHASISPYCFPVNPENWDAVREQLLTQYGWGIGIQLDWFMRAMPAQEQLKALQKHLREWNTVVTPAGEEAILRIGDWRVVKPLLEASTVQEASAFYGPIGTFWQLTPEGSAESLTLTRREKVAVAAPPRTLSDAQWLALLGPSELDVFQRYIAHLREYHGRWRDADDDAVLAFTQQQSEAAQLRGFNSERDIVRYLALATELEPAFIDADWAQVILGQPEYIGTQNRMDRLFEKAIQHLENA